MFLIKEKKRVINNEPVKVYSPRNQIDLHFIIHIISLILPQQNEKRSKFLGREGGN